MTFRALIISIAIPIALVVALQNDMQVVRDLFAWIPIEHATPRVG